MPEFFKQAIRNLTHVVEACRRQNDANAELLFVNFELRSKHYLAMISAQQRLLMSKLCEIPDELQDTTFSMLF